MKTPSGKTGKKAIKSIAYGKKKAKVHIGNEVLEVPLSVCEDYTIYVGKALTPSALESLKKASDDEKLYLYALKLASGFRSTKDVEKKLKLKSEDNKQIWRIIYRIKDQGLLDDERYANDYMEDKLSKGYGAIRIKNDLLFVHEVPRKIVDSLSFPDERKRAKYEAERMKRAYERYPVKAQKEKVMAALVRKGYSSGAAKEAVSSFKGDAKETEMSLEKDAQAILRRYEKKYSGYDLRSRAFRALMSKGYEPSDIEEVLGREEQ